MKAPHFDASEIQVFENTVESVDIEIANVSLLVPSIRGVKIDEVAGFRVGCGLLKVANAEVHALDVAGPIANDFGETGEGAFLFAIGEMNC